MKQVKLKRILCTLVILCVLVSTASATVSDDGQIQPYFIRISSLSTSFSVSSSGYADCYGRVELYKTSDTSELTMELQRSTNKSDWETIKDWTASGKCTVELDKGWYVVSGYYYRIHITAKVYTSSGSLAETASDDSVIARY